MGKMPHLSLSRLAQSYGPLISLRLGTQLLVVGSSPAAATEILKTHDRILSARNVPHVAPAKSPKLNHLSLAWATECNDQWKYLRTICQTELFSSKAIKSQASLREKKVMEMVGFLGTKEGKVVGVGEVVFATVFNGLSNVFVSKDFISLENEGVGGGMKELVRGIMEVASAPNLDDFYPILGGFDLQNLRKKSMELVGRVCTMWEPIINDRRDRKGGDFSSQRDFLDVLIDNKFSNDQINNLLLSAQRAPRLGKSDPGRDANTPTIHTTSKNALKATEGAAEGVDLAGEAFVAHSGSTGITQKWASSNDKILIIESKPIVAQKLDLAPNFWSVGSSPAAATEILKTHDRILSARNVPHVAPAKSPKLNHLSLAWATECNDQWKYLRTICQTELFSSKAIKSQASLREKKVMEMVGFLGTKEGKVVEVGEVVFATVFNGLSNVFVSKDFINLEDEGVGGGMKELVRGIMEVASAPD
ncbi:hypothetical protein HHK36_027798 [Tetracentron sinense]|uniref:Uncharacterized protein n=1 Tax=Tetracentron sinense TaxID=13715 RepID=A0A834YDU5_TETSI|nr:hypothetical protein HHK36_027798 [Tetracentron sinense]